MKIVVVVIVIIAAIALAVLRSRAANSPGGKTVEVTSVPYHGPLSDMLVAIDGPDFGTAQKIVTDFVSMYADGRLDIPAFELQDAGNRKTIVAFSGDMSFDLFCFFTNYVQYPKGESKPEKVRGWAKLVGSANFLTPDLSLRSGMFFLSPNDKDYDRVWFVTDENMDYMISFAWRGGVKRTGEHFYDYEPPPPISRDKPAVTLRLVPAASHP